MTLTVDVRPGVAPTVEISGGEPGHPVVGVAVESGREWTVLTEPVGFRVVDPLAPLGEVFYYRSGPEQTQTLFLESRARDVIMSPAGDIAVECFRSAGKELELDRGVTSIWPKGARRPWTLLPKESRGFTGPLQIVAGAVESDKLAHLLEIPVPVVVKHNQARCTVRHCRVERVQVLTVESASDRNVGFDHEGEVSEWSLSVLPDALTAPVAARSWWHTLHENDSWFGVDVIGEAFK